MNYYLDRLKFGTLALLIAVGCCSFAMRAAADDDSIRIALVSDPHVSLEEQFAPYNVHFAAVVREVNAANVDVVLVAGDLTNHGRRDEFERYNRMRREFTARVISVAGNHDVGNKVMAGKQTTLSDERLDVYRNYVGPLFESVTVSPGFRIVCITSSLLGSGLSRERPQWEFLKQQLPRRNGEFVILLMHYPLFVHDLDEADEYMNVATEPRRRLLEIIEHSGVKLLLSGHQHLPMDQRFHDIHMIGAPAVSFGLPEGEQAVGWTLVTCFAGGKVDWQLHYIE